MIFPSHPSSVPPFHSLGNGTVEQILNQRNSPRNINGTFSLKALANKVLERNKERNTYGTRVLKPVPHPGQPVPLRGTNFEVGCKGEGDDFLYDFEERLAIAEYDGQQTPLRAQRIAYQDAFLSVLNALPYEKTKEEDWLDQRTRAAQAWLLEQGIAKPM